MAKLLMLLSHGGGRGEIKSRVFECKTCSRQFSSFQALGGHRARHRKPRFLLDGGRKAKLSTLAKPRVHKCSVCGLEFMTGQALGGHMRRHRVDGFSQDPAKEEEKILPETKRVPWLDLNLPPMEEGFDPY